MGCGLRDDLRADEVGADRRELRMVCQASNGVGRDRRGRLSVRRNYRLSGAEYTTMLPEVERLRVASASIGRLTAAPTAPIDRIVTDSQDGNRRKSFAVSANSLRIVGDSGRRDGDHSLDATGWSGCVWAKAGEDVSAWPTTTQDVRITAAALRLI